MVMAAPTARRSATLVSADAAGYSRLMAVDELATIRAITAHRESGERILPRFPYVWAEVPHAVRHEMAMTLDDLLIRRLHLFFEARDGGMSIARAVAERMAREPGLGWDAAEIERQVARYEAAVEATRGFA